MRVELNIVTGRNDSADNVAQRLLANLGNRGEETFHHEAGLEAMLRQRAELVLEADGVAVYLTVHIALHVGGKTILFPVAGDRVRLCVNRNQDLEHVVSAYPWTTESPR